MGWGRVRQNGVGQVQVGWGMAGQGGAGLGMALAEWGGIGLSGVGQCWGMALEGVWGELG